MASTADAQQIVHIRRILYRRAREKFATYLSPLEVVAGRRSVEVAHDGMPEVTIVIPTRDRAKLLARCVGSLIRLTEYPRFQVVLVDNGSEEKDALVLLEGLESAPNHHVLRRPGPFNFSALCNDGARHTRTPLLVFLNNDTVITSPHWLTALVKWAIRPDVGVVGAKLLFLDNSIQHAGVVLGLGGIAGHMYEKSDAADPGYLRQLDLPREVGAVTGACIAVSRAKFEAVGGFDAENLPVDLNDIDLCLKASQRGWKTVWTPEAVLLHEESASRGYASKPSQIYQKERRYFIKRWSNEVRDDPYFHPALSLFSRIPALA